ncbi:BTAD domain-containing putative transcriptional regulator, partial [Streptomyces sp. MCAF7]
MRALYGSERQAEALNAFQAMRERLRDELGVDPGKELHT